MPLPRLQLPHGVQIVRADAIEAPIEAMRSEGMGRAAWEPQFLALAEQDEGSESAEAAMCQLHELISVMHLFKAGSVGLGPYAFAPTGEGRWARLATGAPATRPGGYELNESEAVQLAEFADALEARPDPDAALAWAVGRFEMGCGRGSALEGLSDHLLALRAVLDGQGPVGASLPMRASALIACEEFDRIRGARADRAGAGAGALADERHPVAARPRLGELAGGGGAPHPARGRPRRARLRPRHRRRGDPDRDRPRGRRRNDRGHDFRVGDTRHGRGGGDSDVTSRAASRATRTSTTTQATRILEPIPAEGEIRITATPWLDEVEAPESTLDFPAIEGDVQHRERIDTPRVRHLFPVPEDADWQVSELKYDHYGREAG